MAAYGDENRLQQSWPWWRLVLTGLNLLALILSIILSWHFMKGGSIPRCSGESPCEQVLNSRWSVIAGILPVSGLATGAYLSMLLAGLFIGPSTEVTIRRLAWSVMLILGGAIVGSAVWFIILQKWVINDFCLYCMSTHITGIILTALIVWRAVPEFNKHLKNFSSNKPDMFNNISTAVQSRINKILPVTGRFLIGLALAGILAVSQVAFIPKAVYSKGTSPVKTEAIDYHDSPIIGSPDAPYIVTLLFDYECPHCQQLHLMLNEAVRRFNGKLAFALCPTPLNSQCNPYIPTNANEFKNSCELTKISLAIWVANHNAFSAFDNWMYTFDSGDRWHPRNIEAARAKAEELVGKANLNAALTDPWIGQYMQTCIRIYGETLQNGNGGVPKLIFGSHWVIPEPNNVNDLIMILQRSLGLPKP